MPLACREYPRSVVTAGRYEQRDMSLSCPEFARLFFGEPGLFRTVCREEETGEETDLPADAQARLDALRADRDRRLALLRGGGALGPRLSAAGLPADRPDPGLPAAVAAMEPLDAAWTETAAALLRGGPGPVPAELPPEEDRAVTKFAGALLFRYAIDSWSAGGAETGADILRLVTRCVTLFHALWCGPAAQEARAEDAARRISRQVEHSAHNLAVLRRP